MTFKEVQLQEILDIQWGDTKTTKASYVPDGYLAYSATGPDGFLDKFDYDREGIVLSAIGANCGSTFFASGRWSCIKNTIRIFPKNDAIDLKYFFYMTKAPDFWPIRGSAQPFISQTDIRELYVQIPNVTVQKKIGQVLFELEEKISANNALSKTLEDIAQTIFKSWFIDFDPVKAKMVGEKPAGMDSATAALFPDSMEESEFGSIPIGWEIKRIGSLCETVLGGTPSRTRDDFWGGEIPWINSGKVNDFRVLTASECITDIGLAKSATKLLPKGTTILAITGATLGQFSRLEFDSCANQSVVGIKGSDEASNEFIFLNIKNGIHRLISAQTGGAQQHINKEDVNAFQLVYPGRELMNAFTEAVVGMFAQIGVLLNQSISLAAIRDSLLPRLISGELQISEEILAS
jgi:type I restriction enzyme S subunit